VVENLTKVAQIDPTTARWATLEMLALIRRGLVDALAAIFAARDFHHDTKRKRARHCGSLAKMNDLSGADLRHTLADCPRRGRWTILAKWCFPTSRFTGAANDLGPQAIRQITLSDGRTLATLRCRAS
jgi:hypothetical protein